MAKVAKMVQEFHRVFKVQQGARKDISALLLDEEHEELQEALAEGDRLAIAKEMADLAYVLWGSAQAWGIDLDLAIELVHKSNMTKLVEDGKPIFRHDGKVVKGPNYKEPEMEGAVF